VNGVYAAAVERALARYGDGCSAVFVSGGGNDFAGFSDLRPLLGVDCGACTAEDACFNHGTAPGTIEELFDRVQRYYIELIDRIAARVPAAARIFVHSYDYALPSGKAVIGNKAWLKPALVAANVPAALRAACVRYIIDQFAQRLSDLQTSYGGRVLFVDSRGTLAAADWANELHPTAGGFGKVARQKWKPALLGAGVL
ncbi:MAG: SGNH/GDSL hydrolase family protein, partial [Casimicrobiaceae bacterium]